MFLQVLTLIASDKCQFKTHDKVTTTVSSLGKSSAKLLDGKFGFSPAPSNISAALVEDKPIDYVVGNAGLGVVLLVFFIIIFVYSIFGRLFFICCCKPKLAQKCKLLSAITICHIITTAFIFISIIFFFIGLSSICNGVSGVANIPNLTLGGFNQLVDQVLNLCNDVLDTVDSMVNEASFILTDFIDTVNTGNSNGQSKATSAKTKMQQYKNTFSDFSEHDFDTCADETTKSSAADLVAFYIDAEIPDNVIDSCDTLISNSANIADALSSATDGLNNNLAEIHESIDSVKNGDIKQTLDSLKTTSDDVGDKINPYQDSLNKIKKITKIIVIVSTIIYSLMAITLFLGFFLNNCCGRCIISNGWCIFIVVDLCVILPAGIFGAIFLPIYNTCPILEDTFVSFLGDSIPFSKDITNVLLCKEERSIYSMANLSQFFDKDQFVHDLEESINGQSISINTFGLDESFDDFDNGVSDNLISSNAMWPNYESILNRAMTDSDSQCQTKATNLKNLIQSNNGLLGEIRTDMSSVFDFGNSISPMTTQINDRVNHLVTNLPASILTSMNRGIDGLTCQPLKCMYSPIKNTICHYLLNGFGNWILSSIFAIFGIMSWSIIFMIRRKKMAKPQIEPM